MTDSKKYGFTTTTLHSDRQKEIEHGSLHKPIHTSVTFGYNDARELATVFQGKKPGYRSVSYTHLTLPTTPYV